MKDDCGCGDCCSRRAKEKTEKELTQDLENILCMKSYADGDDLITISFDFLVKQLAELGYRKL